jgi:hypothetical protein
MRRLQDGGGGNDTGVRPCGDGGVKKMSDGDDVKEKEKKIR